MGIGCFYEGLTFFHPKSELTKRKLELGFCSTRTAPQNKRVAKRRAIFRKGNGQVLLCA